MNQCQIQSAIANSKTTEELRNVMLNNSVKKVGVNSVSNSASNVTYRYTMKSGKFTVKVNNSILGVGHA